MLPEMGEVSEAALDTLLSTVTALKTVLAFNVFILELTLLHQRLAEARTQREQEQEQRKQQPTRWA